MLAVRQRDRGFDDRDRLLSPASEPGEASAARESPQTPVQRAVLDLQRSAGNAAVAAMLNGSQEGGGELLAVGSSGAGVVRLQEALNANGAQLVADGRFGEATRAAVTQFQAGAGLKGDGIAGPRTQRALGLAGGPVPAGSESGRAVGALVAQAVESRLAAGSSRRPGNTDVTVNGGQYAPSVDYHSDGGTGEMRGAATVPGLGAGSVTRDASGAYSGAVTGSPGGAAGTYDPTTGAVAGQFASSDGQTAGTGSYDPSTGAAQGSIATRRGSGTASYDGNGSGSAAVTTGDGSASASYDASTGQARGALTNNGQFTASGSYNTTTGSGSGQVSNGNTSAAGSWDASTGTASGQVARGDTSASGSYSTATGSGSGQVASGNTSATGSWDNTTNTASGSVSSGSGSGTFTYSTSTGSGSVSATSAGGSSVSADYNGSTGQTTGAVSTDRGGATWNANTDTGNGSGEVHTAYGTGTLSVDDAQIHATVNVPGAGDISVNVERPDWL